MSTDTVSTVAPAVRQRLDTPQRSVRTGDAVLIACAGVAMSVASIGSLYLLRGVSSGMPGPLVHDVLPLDELPNLAVMPLAVYLPVFVGMALLLGWLARSRGLGRIGSAVLLGSVVGGTLFMIDTLSLFAIRQVPLNRAFWLTLHLRTISPPVLLAAGAGALFGRSAGPRHARLRVAFGWLAAGAGILNLLSAVIPHGGGPLLLEGIFPAAVPQAASAATVAAGAGLLTVARGLSRGKRRAWMAAELLLASSSVLHLLKGLDQPETFITGAIAIALLACRAEFDVAGDPASRLPALVWSGVFLLGTYLYGAGALFVNRSLVDQPWSPGFAVAATTRALLGLGVHPSPGVRPPFGTWFPLSVGLLAALGATVTLEAWLRPWRYRLQRQAHEHATADNLVRAWGRDTLAPFTLRDDKALFFSPKGDAFLAYTVRCGVALISGDPIGPPGSGRETLDAFIPFAHAHGWRIAVLGASGASLPDYRSLGLRSMYWGDEAIVDTLAFTLEGRSIRKVRQSVHRLQRAGYRMQILPGEQVNETLRTQLAAITTTWAAGVSVGYVMSLDGLDSEAGRCALFAIGFDQDGVPQGFLHLAVHDREQALSLSTMPRLPGTPNGFNEWLISGTAAWARDHGLSRLSLNFAPFAQLFEPAHGLGLGGRMLRRALLTLKSRLGLQLDNLLRFAEQFRPDWEPRFVVFERPFDLPRVGIAGLRVEGYFGKPASV